jgi:putative component of membrane protein insertase Oxa1/YidC/SpoIIIJ protein YidD
MPRMLIARSAVLCIEAYRRYVSPYKGYACAYHAATGRSSCSRYAQQAIGRRGVWGGVLLLRRRFGRCALAAAAFAEENSAKLKDDKFFGQCDPAVQEFRKLCCSGWLDGLAD